jgi:sialic acid synthase SpsE/L-amino acid N-acyltransferase YncA
MVNHEAIGFEIVRPVETHAKLVMQWRNNPEALEASFHQEKKVWEKFWNEFCDEYFSIPELSPLFVTYEGRRVGFLRFRNEEDPIDQYRKCCEVSINIAPEERGKGIGKLCLVELREVARQRGVDDLYAEVKSDNKTSHKLFLGAGYRDIGSKEKKIEDTGQLVTVQRYVDQLTAAEDSPDPHVYIIAEAGSNWRMGTPQRDHAMARALIDIAVEAGADAVKFQTFRPETVYVHNAGQSSYLSDAGMMEDISHIFADLAIPYEMIHELAEYCKKCGIEFMSSPFSKNDFRVVDQHVQRHKIASYEISHIHLIELAAASGKPTIISTGASVEEDITWAVSTYYQNGGENLTLLQCTAKYPADINSMNLQVIPWLKNRYHVNVGLSDHSRDPLLAPIAAVSLGATVIEKHFTLSNDLPGPDHSFAVLPNELKEMVRCIRETEKILGSGVKNVQKCEKELRGFARRGIQALHPISEGDVFKEGKNIAILRSGNQVLGVHPKHLCEIEGKLATRTIDAGLGIMYGDWKNTD